MADSPSQQLLREQGTEIEYLPFNPLALLAFVFGLLSLFTIVSFAFLPVGIAGIIMGVVAMIGCNEGRTRSGYGLARAAVIFSALGLALGLGHHFGRLGWLTHVARGHAETMIALVEDDRLEEVHSFLYEFYMRPEPGTDLIKYYESKDVPEGHESPPVAALNFWLTVDPMNIMCQDELRGKHEYVGFQEYKRSQLEENIVLRYRYIPASSEIKPILYDVDLKRGVRNPPIGTQWHGFFKGVVIATGEAPKREMVSRFSLDPRKRFKNRENNGNQEASKTDGVTNSTDNPANPQESTVK